MATATANSNGRMKMSKRLVTPSLVYDSHVSRLIDSPSPSKMAALLERVEQGELGVLCQLQMEMERKWDALANVAQTRRGATRSLEWCIEPDQKADEDDLFAQEVADYVGDTLTSIEAWSDALAHLSEAIGPNLAVVETIWEKAVPVDFTIVPYTRLVSHPITNRGVSIRTEAEHMGVPTELFPGKFMVFVPNSRGGFPFKTTLTHASIRSYLMAYHSAVDWMSYSELFGCPIRVGKYPQAMKSGDVETLRQELNEGGTDVAIMMPIEGDVEFKQATGTGETYQKQLDHTDASLAKLWLGQTLTTDVRSSGSRAQAEVHERSFDANIRDADLQAEAMCIRRQLIRYMVELRYPGRNAPVPIFKRKTYEARNVEAERLTLDQLRYAGERNLRLDEDTLYELLNLPKPTTPEPKVKTEMDTAATINELTLGIERATRAGDLGLVNALRVKIAELLGVDLPPLTELPKIAAQPGKPNLTDGTAPDNDAGDEGNNGAETGDNDDE